MIEVNNLSKKYTQHTGIYKDNGSRELLELTVLENVSFNIQGGEVVSILGRSGSGKSTLLNLLGLLDSDFEGVIRINSQNLTSLNEKGKARFRNKSIGFIFQSHHLMPEITALENVMLPMMIGGLSYAKAKNRAMADLEAVLTFEEMKNRTWNRISAHLSGGQRQRVAIARAMANRPLVILADEPTGNLDEANKDTVFDKLVKFSKNLGTTVVVVTHDLKLASRTGRTFELKNRNFHERNDFREVHHVKTRQSESKI